MLISRTPLRVSIGGGGTDLPSFYEQHGGFVISAAISKYIYIAINKTFTDDYFIKYSGLERVTSIDEIDHRIVRAALKLNPIPPGVEIDSVADIPSGTGLGSSGAFTVGLLKAIHAFNRDHLSVAELAEEACHIEMDLLQQPVGKQDPYIAAFGGLTCFEFHADGSTTARPLALSTESLHDLAEHLVMFFTGYSREATSVLADQQRRSVAGDRHMIENLQFVMQTGLEIKTCLEQGDMEGFAALMHEHWMRKRERSSNMSNESIDRWYDRGIAAGALGGKLVGAGAGGFLMFYAPEPRPVRDAMAEAGLTEVRFTFDLDGAMIIVRD